MCVMNPTIYDQQVEPRHSVPATLFWMALPIIVSMMSRTMMSLVDFIMVAQLGTEAQAAIMPAQILVFTIGHFGIGVLTLVNTLVSQSLGRGEPEHCGRYAWQGLYIGGVLGLAVLPLIFVARPLFAWVGHDPVVQEMETIYVQIMVLGLMPAMMGYAMIAFFNGLHKPTVSMVFTIIANIFNFAANYVLIFGFWIIEPMGFAGAAWGTVASQVLMFGLLFGWMMLPKFRRAYGTLSQWRLHWPSMRRLIGLGAPTGIHFTSDLVMFTIFTLFLVGQFGTVQLAAHNLVFRFLEFAFMPMVGLSEGLTACVGKSVGARNAERARQYVRWAIVFAVGYNLALGTLYVTVGTDLARLINNDPAVLVWVTKLLWVCALFMLVDGLGITHAGALRGAGDTRWPSAVAVVLSISIMIGGGYSITILYPELQSLGPWLCAAGYIITLGLMMVWRFWRGPWPRLAERA